MNVLKSASAATSSAFEATSTTLANLVNVGFGETDNEPVVSPGTYARRGTVVEAVSLETLESMDDADDQVPVDPEGSMTSGMPFSSNESKNERKTSKDYQKHDLNGIIWHIVVVEDDFSNPAHVLPNGELKPKRYEISICALFV
jgi:hypothetical protein